jgi:hypothetical protein
MTSSLQRPRTLEKGAAVSRHLVKEDERLVWVAALAHEHVYAYVANTGRFHDNNALRNDFYMVRRFT